MKTKTFIRVVITLLIFVGVTVFIQSCSKKNDLEKGLKGNYELDQSSSKTTNSLEVSVDQNKEKSSLPCSPAVSFSTTWMPAQMLYNCSSMHNGCIQSAPPVGYTYQHTLYKFQTYWSLNQNGPFTQGTEIEDAYLDEDIRSVNFYIGNPSYPGKYYFVKCMWYNKYWSQYGGFSFGPVLSVNSEVKLLGHITPVTISGPLIGWEGSTYTYTAVPGDNYNTLTYSWYYSADGGVTYPDYIGSGQTISWELTEEDLNIKVVATALNGSSEDYHVTHVKIPH